jgi:hypothetical protein
MRPLASDVKSWPAVKFGFTQAGEGVRARRSLYIMAKKPELLVDYNSSSHPISAKCSVCGVQMPVMESKGASSAESIKWFAIQFELHVRHKHNRQAANQSAARIVREATE